VPQNWVDRHTPVWLLPYLRLARADRPIGFFLLALPCFWSVALAGRSVAAPYPDPWLLLLFAIGAIVMRAAGCTYNDIVDRDIDAQVARTRSRPLPSGQVSAAQASIFMGLLSLAGLAVLLSFNRFAILLGLGVIPIVTLYPFVKRISHWPQAVLGLAFNWGALMGWAAVLARLGLAPLILYAGAVAWTVGYDTIYAHQDREDDELAGMKSTALRFGRTTKTWLSLFYAFAWSAMVIAGLLVSAGLVFLVGMGIAGAQLAWQVATLDIDDADNCLARFRSNRDFGLIVFAALALDMAVASLA
jgi:4-hydroxybenzoate polyprenyltransferase